MVVSPGGNTGGGRRRSRLSKHEYTVAVYWCLLLPPYGLTDPVEGQIAASASAVGGGWRRRSAAAAVGGGGSGRSGRSPEGFQQLGAAVGDDVEVVAVGREVQDHPVETLVDGQLPQPAADDFGGAHQES
jgi:hypothetical protein